MVIKYYGSSTVTQYVGWTACHPTMAKLYATNPYKHIDLGPSYCVWIVPGTVNSDGDDLVYYHEN